MATSNYGYPGDVNNSISSASAYPQGRAFSIVPPGSNRYRFRNNSMGELSGANPGVKGMSPANMGGQSNVVQMPMGNGRPVTWWITLLVLFILISWAAKRFAPSEQREFGNINPGLYNGVFLTLYIVLILNVLKVFATKFKIPGLSDLILAA